MNSSILPIERHSSVDGPSRSTLPSVPVLDSDHPLGKHVFDEDENNDSGIASIPYQFDVDESTDNSHSLERDSATSTLPNLRKLCEIFPEEGKQKLLCILEECKNNLDDAVMRILDKPSETTKRVNSLQRSASGAISSDREKFVDAKPRPASSRFPAPLQTNDRHVLSKKKLPPGFLCTPVIRTRITSPPTMDPNICFSYTVNYNRRDCGLDVNVKQQKQKIVVNGLYTNKYGFPGLSFRAGIEVGDILYGINDEFFDSTITLKHVTTVLTAAGQYVKLHFIRFAEARSVPAYIEGGAKDPSVQLRKIHPCALLLLDQEVLDVEHMETFCDTLSRIKERALTWGTGSIVHRSRIRDIADAVHGGNGSVGSVSSLRDDVVRSRMSTGVAGARDSTSNKSRRASVSSAPLSFSQTTPSPGTDDVGDIRQNWYKDVSMNTVDLRPALFICITGTTVVEAHQEYIIRVEDISTGMEWFVRRRYKEFFKLREVYLLMSDLIVLC